MAVKDKKNGTVSREFKKVNERDDIIEIEGDVVELTGDPYLDSDAYFIAKNAPEL